MKGKNSKNIRVDTKFNEKMIEDIQKQKMLQQGKFVTPRRITLAITRHPLTPRIKKDIIREDLK